MQLQPGSAEQIDPRHLSHSLRGMMADLVHRARENVAKVDDPRAQALFETTAEVLRGLDTAYAHYEAKSERAWGR